MDSTTADAGLDFSASEHSPASCAGCGAAITDQYWSANGAVLCAGCKARIEDGQTAPAGVTASAGRFSRALGFGLLGMLLGSGLWYAVARLADMEVGLIAILLGFLVGKGVLIGSGHRGGRRYQLLAVALTYFGIGVAYTPFAVEAMRKSARAAADSAALHAAPAPAPGGAAVAAEPVSAMSPAELDQEGRRLDSMIAAGEAHPAPVRHARPGLLAYLAGAGLLLFGILTLPVIVTLGGFPGSIISVLIYSFALIQAWRMTRGTRLTVTGPYQVGSPAAA